MSPLLILNTVLVVFLQVRASRGVDGVESGATVTRRAGGVFTLASPHAQGQYQGVFNLGTGGCIALAPLILTTLCIAWGWPGWLVLGPMFVLSGALTIPAARWAERTRSTAA